MLREDRSRGEVREVLVKIFDRREVWLERFDASYA